MLTLQCYLYNIKRGITWFNLQRNVQIHALSQVITSCCLASFGQRETRQGRIKFYLFQSVKKICYARKQIKCHSSILRKHQLFLGSYVLFVMQSLIFIVQKSVLQNPNVTIKDLPRGDFMVSFLHTVTEILGATIQHLLLFPIIM